VLDLLFQALATTAIVASQRAGGPF
jgi:hypothetical protein